MSNALKKIYTSNNQPLPGTKPPAHQVRQDKELYEAMSEKDIDKTLKDSFPASDPPSY